MAIIQIDNSFECIDKFGNTTAFYKANAGDITKIKFNVSENIFAESNNSEIIVTNSVLRSENKYVFPNYESMNGFAVGQTVTLIKTISSGATSTITTTIVSINYSLRQIEFAALFSPINANLYTYDSINVLTIVTGNLRSDLYLNLSFVKSNAPILNNNILSTNQGAYAGATSTNRKSLIDNTNVRLYGVNAGSISIGSNISLLQTGIKSGGFEIKNAKITRNANIGTNLRSFSIEFDIIQLGPLVPTAFLNDSQFIRLYYDLEWYSSTDTLNPTVLAMSWNNVQTAYFNVPAINNSFNSTFNSSNGEQLNFEIPVTKTVTFTSSSSLIAMGSLYVPQNDAYYKNSQYDQSNLCMLIEQNAALAVGTYSSKVNQNGAGYTIEILSKTYAAGLHTVTYKFTPNSAFISFMNTRSAEDRLFYIWFKVGNINHLVYSDNLISAPIPTYDLTDYITSPTLWRLDKTSDTYIADTLSDGVVCSKRDNLIFELKGLFPNIYDYQNVTFQVIVAEVANLNNYFAIENYLFDLSQIGTLPNGALINFSQLQAVNNNSIPTSSAISQNVIVSRKGGPADDTFNFGLFFRYPLLINWRYWQQQLNAFDLFDENRTNDWFNYSNGDYQIFLKTNVQTEQANLLHYAPIKQIYNYNDDHSTVEQKWKYPPAIEYFIESTGVLVNSLIDNEIIRIKIYVQHEYAATSSTAWGQIGIEPKESSPRYVCSTNYADDNNINNPFLPLSGETRLKHTIIDPLESYFEILLDTNLLNSTNYTIDFKFYNDTTPIEQVRSEFDVILTPSSVFEAIDYTLQDDEECCDNTFDVFAETVQSGNSFTNDITSAWKVVLGGDSVEFELYKNNVFMETMPIFTFPNQTNARYTLAIWRTILLDYGVGCYEIRIKYTFDEQEISTIWGRYNLQEWTNEGVQGMVRLQAIFNTNQSVEGIDFTDAYVPDTLNINGFFGKRDPNMEIRNNVYSSRLSVKVVRENINTYELTTNPITRTFSRKLLDLFLLSENNMLITDYNTFNHEVYINKRVIVSESPTIEHFDFSNKIKIICKFEDKIKNQRSFH